MIFIQFAHEASCLDVDAKEGGGGRRGKGGGKLFLIRSQFLLYLLGITKRKKALFCFKKLSIRVGITFF